MDVNNQMKIKEDISRRLAPIGLVPVASGTAFLIMGSKNVDNCPGHPSLPIMLLFAGTLTLSLGVMTNVGKFIVAYGLPSGRQFTRQEKNVVWLLRYLRHFLSLSQVLILVAGTIVIAPLASTIHPWNWEDPSDPFFCDYSIVVFTATFFPMMWFLFFLAMLALIVIKCTNFEQKTAEEKLSIKNRFLLPRYRK